MSQLTLCKNQFLFKSVGVRIFCVDLTWNDPIVTLCQCLAFPVVQAVFPVVQAVQVAEQLDSLHTLSSTTVLVIYQNSSCNIVANRYSDSKYTGPFSCAVWSVHVYRQDTALFWGSKQNSKVSSLMTEALLVQKIFQQKIEQKISKLNHKNHIQPEVHPVKNKINQTFKMLQLPSLFARFSRRNITAMGKSKMATGSLSI